MKVGVSGHQQLGSIDTIKWIKCQLLLQLQRTDFSCGISSLAAGADQLFAKTVLDLGRDIEVIIPCTDYESAFENSTAREEFRRLKKRARQCFLLDYAGPSEKAFFAAGKLVVEMCDLLFAVWDGEPAAGLGGTADVVKHALKSGKEVFHINPTSFTAHFVRPD
jgi:hypothetical protein